MGGGECHALKALFFNPVSAPLLQSALFSLPPSLPTPSEGHEWVQTTNDFLFVSALSSSQPSLLLRPTSSPLPSALQLPGIHFSSKIPFWIVFSTLWSTFGFFFCFLGVSWSGFVDSGGWVVPFCCVLDCSIALFCSLNKLLLVWAVWTLERRHLDAVFGLVLFGCWKF